MMKDRFNLPEDEVGARGSLAFIGVKKPKLALEYVQLMTHKL